MDATPREEHASMRTKSLRKAVIVSCICPPIETSGIQDDALGADVFKALGDEKRMRIMRMIARNPGICSCKILEEFEMSQSTFSHHMKLLCEAGLVGCEKDGRWTHYTLYRQGLDSAMETLQSLEREAEGESHA